MNTHSSLPPPSPIPVFEEKDEISKKLSRESKLKKSLYGKPKGGR